MALGVKGQCWLCGLGTGKAKRYTVRAWQEDTLFRDARVCHRCFCRVQESGEVKLRRGGVWWTVRPKPKDPAPGDDEPTA